MQHLTGGNQDARSVAAGTWVQGQRIPELNIGAAVSNALRRKRTTSGGWNAESQVLSELHRGSGTLPSIEQESVKAAKRPALVSFVA